jgi:hypothetical protein
MFIRGVSGNHERRSFRIWEEGVAPTVIFAMTSKDTRYEDEVWPVAWVIFGPGYVEARAERRLVCSTPRRYA